MFLKNKNKKTRRETKKIKQTNTSTNGVTLLKQRSTEPTC